jgi:hypothetical protein
MQVTDFPAELINTKPLPPGEKEMKKWFFSGLVSEY